MKITTTAALAVMGALALIGCKDQAQTRNGVGACNAANSGHDCIHLNGDGVHVARTMPLSAAGIRGERRLPWQLLGFETAGGRVIANGWYDGMGPADAEITHATLAGERVQLRAVESPDTHVRADVAGANGPIRSVSGEALSDLVLTLAVPAPSGDATTPFDIRIRPSGALAGSSLGAYAVEFRERSGAGGRSGNGQWTSYCAGPDGAPVSATVMPGVQWTPDDATRRDGDHLVALTCESGAVAQCALWGYSPWAFAMRPGGDMESLADYHQACVHMKRGAYCGTNASYTEAGTPIEVADPFGIQRTSVERVEAVWDADGAVCLSTPRDADTAFAGCPDPLPACPDSPAAGPHLVSGLPR